METILRAENLCRDFSTPAGPVHALQAVTLSVGRGCLTVLRGRSGSGKTTLLNLLGALDEPTSGRVELDGREITALPGVERDRIRRCSMGFVFQSIALLSDMTALENVEFALRVAGVARAGRAARAEDALHQVGLRARMHHRPHELSGGEQQRVAIARAIAHRPPVIFADEPTAELDTQRALQVMKLFRELVQGNAVSIVMTTHDAGLMELADACFTLEDGRLTDA
jgi:putative ABC transport system ATP-binding protein